MGYFDFTDLGNEGYLGKKITFTVTYSYCSASFPAVSPVYEYYGYLELGSSRHFEFTTQNTAACATTTFVLKNKNLVTMSSNSNISIYTTYDPKTRHFELSSAVFDEDDIGEYIFTLIEKDNLDDGNRHVRYIVIDIVGCIPDPVWYSASYDWSSFTYYIGGNDLVVEFNEWTNGNCEVNLTYQEKSTWSYSLPWFVTTAPTYTVDATYSTQMTLANNGFMTISTDDP